MNDRPPITPETRVAELLQAYPELEALLIAQAPVFKALKNPVLRRTVAKAATLRKAAEMGNIPIRKLIQTLRHAAGLDTRSDRDDASAPDAESAPTRAPGWLDEQRVVKTLDADELLEAGEFPLTKIRQELQRLDPGDILGVTSTFRPAPLVEALAKRFRVATLQAGAGRWITYIAAGPSPTP